MIGTHLVNHTRNKEVRSESTLYVIGVISNPCRYQSRYRIAREWIKAMERTPHVQLAMVETAFGDRFHEVTEAGNPWHLQLRNQSSIWIKESMINLGVARLLPRNWKYAAWIDCDVFFRNPDWAIETIHMLQHHPVVQPWRDCLDLGPYGSIMEIHRSFGSLIATGQRRQKNPCEPYRFGHPGFAWACRRDFWEAVQGLMDHAILGSGDHHCATAMVNEVGTSIFKEMSNGFKRQCYDWQYRAYRHSLGNIGYLPGVIEHQFHGSKKKRYYKERWKILTSHAYDPDRDLGYDDQGLIQLHGKPTLEREIHDYTLSRQEDSTDHE